MYKAASQFQVASTLGQSGEYGAQVARLQIAVNALEDAKKRHLKGLPSDVQQQFNNLHTVY